MDALRKHGCTGYKTSEREREKKKVFQEKTVLSTSGGDAAALQVD